MNYEISSDGRTVWVNSNQGICVARFCPISSEFFHPHFKCIIHENKEPQTYWSMFVEEVLSLFKIQIENEHKPLYI